MVNVKHVSLDVWNTLIRPSKVFAERRTHLLATEFNTDATVVKQQYTLLKQSLDNHARQTGYAQSTLASYRTLAHLIRPKLEVTDDDLQDLEHKIQRLFIQHPPTVEQSAIAAIDQLHDSGITFSILSNTNFISGRVMAPLLREMIGDYFMFFLFSDLELKSKPHQDFFNQMISTSRYPREYILHVGDDMICDVDGASLVGVRSRLLTDPIQLAPVLLTNVGY